MKYRHIYDPVAIVEYKEAVSWYKHRSIVAAENFVKEVTDKIIVICNYPSRFRNAYSVFRETALKKFPYTIVYFVDEKKKKVIVTSIFHNKRNPAKKYRKN
jgi:plasmid stabilization system protein ParE